MFDKRVKTTAEALAGVKDGQTVMISGFQRVGAPETLILALLETGAKGLTLIANGIGYPGSGIAQLIEAGRVEKYIASSARGRGSEMSPFEKLWSAGKIELELVPQGSFAERIRAGGAGHAGFYTPTGVGTDLAAGKEERRFGDRDYILETALTADFAMLRAERGDRFGNLIFRGSQANFGPVMATAARVTVAEVNHLDEGALDPHGVHAAGIFVNRVIHIPGGA
jgi:3-oxoadipate CoA-transferase, alpha subunit